MYCGQRSVSFDSQSYSYSREVASFEVNQISNFKYQNDKSKFKNELVEGCAYPHGGCHSGGIFGVSGGSASGMNPCLYSLVTPKNLAKAGLNDITMGI